MTKLADIPTKDFPLSVDHYRKIKSEIVSAAEQFEDHSQHEIAGDLFKIADALDDVMNKIIYRENFKL